MISVVMATYNGEKFIKEQLDSICNQTMLPDEIVIQDDISKDGTLKIVREYKEKFNSIKWKIEKNLENVGYKVNFYNAICNSNGDFIFLCDQDDIWKKDKIEKMVKIMQDDENILLLMSSFEPFYQENCKNKIHTEKYFGKKIVKFKNLNHCINTPRPGCTFCCRRNLIEKYKKLVNFKIPHDNFLWQIASINNNAYLLNEKLILYRRHANNASNNKVNSMNKRLQAINTQIYELQNIIESFDLNTEQKNYFECQMKIFETRYNLVKNHDLIKYLGLLKNIKYFYNIRLVFSDIYYIIKYRGEK